MEPAKQFFDFNGEGRHPFLKSLVVNQAMASILAFLSLHFTLITFHFLLTIAFGLKSKFDSTGVGISFDFKKTSGGEMAAIFGSGYVIVLLILTISSIAYYKPQWSRGFLKLFLFWIRLYTLSFFIGGLLSDAITNRGLGYILSVTRQNKLFIWAVAPIVILIFIIMINKVSSWFIRTAVSPKMVDEGCRQDYTLLAGIFPALIGSGVGHLLIGFFHYRVLGMSICAFIFFFLIYLTVERRQFTQSGFPKLKTYTISKSIAGVVGFMILLTLAGRIKSISSLRFVNQNNNQANIR